MVSQFRLCQSWDAGLSFWGMKPMSLRTAAGGVGKESCLPLAAKIHCHKYSDLEAHILLSSGGPKGWNPLLQRLWRLQGQTHYFASCTLSWCLGIKVTTQGHLSVLVHSFTHSFIHHQGQGRTCSFGWSPFAVERTDSCCRVKGRGQGESGIGDSTHPSTGVILAPWI